MIAGAEISNRTGIVYLREDASTHIGMPFSEAVNLLNPMFSWTRTGENTITKPFAQFKVSRSLLPYKLLSMTTGSEVTDISAPLLAILVLSVTSNNTVTDYHATFEIKNSQQIKSYLGHITQVKIQDTNSASMQAEHLREMSGLKVERLAEIFGVSRTTYYKWIAGSPLHDMHREHLLEVFTLIEEANQRLGGSGATNVWLLTPVSPGGKKPIDYLSEREYSIFRGFLLRIRTVEGVFQPITSSRRAYMERSQEEIEDALERLRPRAWPEGNGNDTDVPDADN